MSAISIGCFFVVILILVSCLRKGADVFSPARVFGGVWFFSIALTDLKFSYLQHEWSALSWIVIWVGVLSFLLGIFIVNVLTMRARENSVREIRSVSQNRVINERVLFWGTTAFFLGYCLAFVVETMAFGGLPIFSPRPDVARTRFGIFGFHLFISGGMPVVLILVEEYFILVKGNGREKIILAAACLITFVTHGLLLVRYTYMVFVLAGLAFAYYSSRLMKVRNLMIFFSLIALVFVGMIQIREGRYIEHYIYIVSRMKIPLTYEWITGPYMYIAMNLENCARAVDQVQYYTYGYYTLDFVLALSGLKHWISDYFGIGISEYLTSGFNTFPFLFYSFQDFGLAGLFVLSTLSGLLVGAVYHWMKLSASFIAIILYACCVYLMGISFFNNSASYLNFNFTWISLAVINILMQRYTKKSEDFSTIE
jgi:oligosaccharide repeat unit polymerase